MRSFIQMPQCRAYSHTTWLIGINLGTTTHRASQLTKGVATEEVQMCAYEDIISAGTAI